MTQPEGSLKARDPAILHAAVIRRVQDGDVEAFSTLVEAFERRLRSLCLALSQDLTVAEEITQEAFVRAFRYLSSFDSHRPFYPWLAKIAVRLLQKKASMARQPELPLETGIDRPVAAEHPLTNLIHEEDGRALWRAVLSLPGRERAAVILFYRQELTVRQTSDVLGVTTGTVKTWLFRARRHLREKLTENTKER